VVYHFQLKGIALQSSVSLRSKGNLDQALLGFIWRCVEIQDSYNLVWSICHLWWVHWLHTARWGRHTRAFQCCLRPSSLWNRLRSGPWLPFCWSVVSYVMTILGQTLVLHPGRRYVHRLRGQPVALYLLGLSHRRGCRPGPLSRALEWGPRPPISAWPSHIAWWFPSPSTRSTSAC